MLSKALAALITVGFAPLVANAAATCKLQKAAELPVTMAGTQPLIAGSINGMSAHFIADSGAFFSTLSRASAEKFKLRLGPLPQGLVVRGVGGAIDALMATAKEFSVEGLGTRAFHYADFVVIPNSFPPDVDGVIGQNLIGHADTEYDLANGVIRLFLPKNCGNQALAYWHGSADVAMVEMGYTADVSPKIIGSAKLNGAKIRVLFDSGAARSILTLRAAARAGIKPDSAGVIAAGFTNGIGRQELETWIARFDNLDLGGEQVKNARLRIGDLDLTDGADMLLGADFFLSHRIYVAASQNRIYFTYNGGQVFDLRVTNQTKPSGPAAAAKPAAAASAQETQPAPTDAAGFRRRGAAAAARQDLASAIADFDRAIELDPAEPQNYFLRGISRLRNHQAVLAMGDFDQVLKMQPNDIPTLLERGTLRLVSQDAAGARADFDAAVGVAPGDASLSLRIAQTYVGTGHFDEAINRFDQWIAAYPKDDRLADALRDRCWSRVMNGKDLDLALADCNNALKRGPRTSQVLGSRATAWLRLGQFDKSIADYQASLSLQPKSALSLYGLGVAELKKGMQAQGDRDIQAALAIAPPVAGAFKRLGLSPQ